MSKFLETLGSAIAVAVGGAIFLMFLATGLNEAPYFVGCHVNGLKMGKEVQFVDNGYGNYDCMVNNSGTWTSSIKPQFNQCSN